MLRLIPLIVCISLAFSVSPIGAITLDDIPPAWSRILDATTRFQTALNGASVLDNETGLVWEKAPSTIDKYYWEEAYRTCLAKKVAGRMGWRMPSVAELTSLLDVTDSGTAGLAAGHPFENIDPAAPYWTATWQPFGGQKLTVTLGTGKVDNAWILYMTRREFTKGMTRDDLDRTFARRVWCVRGGRSDNDLTVWNDHRP